MLGFTSPGPLPRALSSASGSPLLLLGSDFPPLWCQWRRRVHGVGIGMSGCRSGPASSRCDAAVILCAWRAVGSAVVFPLRVLEVLAVLADLCTSRKPGRNPLSLQTLPSWRRAGLAFMWPPAPMSARRCRGVPSRVGPSALAFLNQKPFFHFCVSRAGPR